MALREEILDACKIYCARAKKMPSTVGNMIVNDGKFFDRIEAGGGCTMATYEKVMCWFKENTPPPEQPPCQ